MMIRMMTYLSMHSLRECLKNPKKELTHNSFSFFIFNQFIFLNIYAKIDPARFCHTEYNAPGTVA